MRRWRAAVRLALLAVGIGVTAMHAATAAKAAPAQISAADLLGRHAEARGGAARWKTITSLEITGTQTTYSTPNPFTLTRRRPNLFRLDQTILGRPVVYAFDGRTAWSIDGILGHDWPLTAPPPYASWIRREAAFDTPLLAADPALKVELVGLESFEGRQVYKLRVGADPASEETWYLDPKTFLEVARISKTVDFFEEMEKRSYFSDFRNVAGLVLPHRIDMEYGTRSESLAVSKVVANADVDQARFALPLPDGMGALASLKGDWNLKIETRQGPRAPWVAETATSSIASLLGGGMLEERFSHVDQGFPLDLVRTITYDRFKKVYRITSADTFAFQQNVMEGPLADGELTASNQTTGTTQSSAPDPVTHTRVVLSELQESSFRMDLESSSDGGKTWNTDAKYTYTRK